MSKVTLGGDRLGSGKKMQVDLKAYERSTHDLSYLWRSTMSGGTLVPFMVKVVLPGDTFDIDLEMDGKSHPTTGPLFGSWKWQLDVFQAPIRLYQGQLHNNKLDIGNKMQTVKLPQMLLGAPPATNNNTDKSTSQVNPSCLLAYLGIRGIGTPVGVTDVGERYFNAVPLLAYWDIFKNYYANKQETNAFVIHTDEFTSLESILTFTIGGTNVNSEPINVTGFANIVITYDDGIGSPDPRAIVIVTNKGNVILNDVTLSLADNGTGNITALWDYGKTGNITVFSWKYQEEDLTLMNEPKLTSFPLKEIDDMREELLSRVKDTEAVDIQELDIAPYKYLLQMTGTTGNRKIPYKWGQEGLAVKTYQSDLNNNWLNTEWIDGVEGINEITAIDTTTGKFSLDTMIMARKVYDMLKSIALRGVCYNDWINAAFDTENYGALETPIYHGSLIREMVFQEVVSNSATESTSQTQPLGTLGGKGVMAQKRKGGKMRVKVTEPGYLIGIVSGTPRIDYSQGNHWDVNLKTMDDFHKPGLDEIGFEDKMQGTMAWWTTEIIEAGGIQTIVEKAAGKQPAWVNYMSSVNETYGNFAIEDNEMFMTLNRKYSTENGADISDLTTYIDPQKYNNSFAETSLDAQNFWVQIAVGIEARRKMSAKLMPNL